MFQPVMRKQPYKLKQQEIRLLLNRSNNLLRPTREIIKINDTDISNTLEIVYKCSDYFANIGLILAFKLRDSNKTNSHRLISVLPYFIFSEFFEKIMPTRLMKYLSKI